MGKRSHSGRRHKQSHKQPRFGSDAHALSLHNETIHDTLLSIQTRLDYLIRTLRLPDDIGPADTRMPFGRELTAGERFPFGQWESTDIDRRWSLDFNDNGCVWVERRGASILQRSVPLERDQDGWIIHRDNDAEVLRFLEAREEVINEIQIIGPAPSFMRIAFVGEHMNVQWNGLRWTLDSQGHLDSLQQPGSAPVRNYGLLQIDEDEKRWYRVPRHQLTFGAEGQEGIRLYHSRWIHWPETASSGVTLGRGYDMHDRSEQEILEDLVAAGLTIELGSQFAAAAGLIGQDARTFVRNRRETLGNITPGQQQRLFLRIISSYEQSVMRISRKRSVVNQYGEVDFDVLDRRIWTVVVDLRYKGEYSVNPRRGTVVQLAMVENDIVAFRALIADRDNWPNSHPSRIQARLAALR